MLLTPMLLTPPPPSSVKITNTTPTPIHRSKESIGTSFVHFVWPVFNKGLFDETCTYFANVIGEIKTQIPPDDYRDNDVECCPPALINIAKDMIMLFMTYNITTPHATHTYETGYKVLILSVIGYYLIHNEWENVHKRIKILLPDLFDDSMMVIMKMATSGFGHSEFDSKLREITKRFIMVDLNINIRPIRKPNNGGGRTRLTRRRRRKLKPSKRMTKHYK